MQDNKAYSRQKHRIAILEIILYPTILFLLIVSGLPTYLKNVISLSLNNYINLLGFYALTGFLYYLITLPLIYYSGFILEQRFRLSNQKFKDWATREIKKSIITFIFGVPIVFATYFFLKNWPFCWWLLTAIFWYFLSILVAKFFPTLIVPLFYKYSPIKDSILKDKLIKLSQKAGFKVESVYEIDMSKDTKKANAALMGLGRQKRIVLCDTLINNFSYDEIESVMGHELGHHSLRHILKLTMFAGLSAAGVFFAANILVLHLHNLFGYARLYDFETLILIFTVISFLNIFVLPLQNAFSRRLEHEADRFTLEITNNKPAFVATMKKLAAQNLAEPDPSKFYEIMLYNHPPISRRISFAESFKTEK